MSASRQGGTRMGTGREDLREVVSHFFDTVGLGAPCALVYAWVSEEGAATESELATVCSLDPAQVGRAVEELVQAGFVRVSQSRPRLVSILRPDAGIASAIVSSESTVATQLDRLATVRQLAQTLQTSLADLQAQREVSSFETLEDSHATVSRLHELNHDTRQEILTCVPTRPSVEALRVARLADARLLDRGVKVRGIYLQACRNDPATMDYLQWMQDKGAEVRLAVTLPARLQIFDGRTAVVADSTHGSTSGAIVVHSGGLVSSLLRLFEYAWDGAAAPFGTPESISALPAQQREILWWLARGAKDDAVARHMGVSTRTVRRTISELSIALGAASRFELGVKFAQLGLASGAPVTDAVPQP